jgi:hypothetical protein
MKISENGVIREMTAEEKAQREQDVARDVERKEAQISEETAQANLKASAKAKLVAGEKLTEEEANILVGV